jgi:hypothetical protein
MGNPRVGFEIPQLIVLHILLGIADKLEYQKVSTVREHESSLLTQGCIKFVVQPV